jgi:hypothetical protein
MPIFNHPLLLWGLLIAGLPVLIHLINMMRHRRIRWAAMEFLLVSQKKHRTWILLKQLLLLLMRMAAVSLVVLAVAQPVLNNELGSRLGSNKTHHFVLLDDSFSMSDHWDDTSAWAQAKAVVARIAALASRQVQPQTFTLLRYSQAVRSSGERRADFVKESVGAEFLGRLRRLMGGEDDARRPAKAMPAAKGERVAGGLKTSLSAAGPLPALEAVGQYLEQSKNDRRVLYLLTDFRARQWNEPGELRGRLARLSAAGIEIHLINCVDAEHANLAISDLRAGRGTRAAGVPLFMEVSVTNFGPALVHDVPVMIEADDQALPAVKTGEIPPGKTVKERFPVYFATPGPHRIEARLDADVIAEDNERWCALDFPAGLPVLLIDGDPEARDAAYLAAALDPGRPVVTGIQPRIEKPRFLSVNVLDGFRAIYLLNVERLDASAVEAVEKYVAGGGGLGVFLGPRSSTKFLNDALYRGGKGVFPLPVSGEASLLIDRLQKTPDLEVGAHPIFSVLAGKRNSFIAAVNVERYMAAAKGWKPAPDSGVQVIAHLRNGAPLAVERRFGEGKVVAFLTTAAPDWNNWARNNPSFPVAMQELQAYLSREPADTSRLVGTPLVVKLPPAQYDRAVRFVTPEKEALPVVVNAVPTSDGALTAGLTATDFAGICRVVLHRRDGQEETRQFAYNVDPDEGDLRVVPDAQLAQQFRGVARYQRAAEFQSAGDTQAGYQITDLLLYVLAGLLVVEQLLAWSASYHRSARPAVSPARGAA